MLTCFDVAKYFLSLCNDEESGDLISNLKIQKLVYYAQGFSLAINNKPLFKEKFKLGLTVLLYRSCIINIKTTEAELCQQLI